MTQQRITQATSADRAEYPQYRERFGEDPARFLYHMDARPRIRAIDDVDLLRAYQHVESERDEPDRELIGQISARIQRLSQTGDGNPQAAVATDGGVDR